MMRHCGSLIQWLDTRLFPGTEASRRRVRRAVSGLLVFLAFLAGLSWLWPELFPARTIFVLHGMQFNTALLLGLAGTALLIAETKFHRMAALIAFTIAVLAAITFAQYLLYSNWGLDQLFVHANEPIASIYPGRMAPNTALAFVLFSLGMILIAWRDQSRRAQDVALVLGLAIVSISIMSLLGQVSESLGYLHGFWYSQRASVLVGPALIVMGVVLMCLARDRIGAKHGISRLALALVFIVSALVVPLSGRFYLTEYERHFSTAAQNRMERLKRDVLDNMNERRRALGRLAGHWLQDNLIASGHWVDDATLFQRDYPEIIALSYADPQLQMRFYAPSSYAKLPTGHRIDRDDERKRTVWRAIDSRKEQMTGLVRLVKGSLGMVMMIPMFVGNEFKGLLLAASRNDAFFEQFFLPSERDFYVQIFDDSSGASAYSFGDAEALRGPGSKWLRQERFDLFGHTWRIEIVPTTAFIMSNQEALAPVVLLAGVIIALLLGVAIQYAYFAADRARENQRNASFVNSLLNCASLAIISTDMNGVMTSFNRAAEKMLGYRAEDLIGKASPQIFYSEADFARRNAERERSTAVARQFHVGEIAETELTWIRKDGSRFPVLLSQTAMTSERGEIFGFVGIGVDLTEKKARQSLYEEQRAKLFAASKINAIGEMAGGVAHEINNPLAVISAKAERLRELAKDGRLEIERVIQECEKIDVMVKRIARIISSLISVSRDGAKERFIATGCRGLIENSVVLCSEMFRAHGVALSFADIDPNLKVECRPSEISQAMLNLLNNSFHAVKTLEEKWVRIDCEETQGFVRVIVTDSGAGIGEEIRTKIFQPFFTTRKVGEGAGLGLCMARGIIAGHQGRLYLDEQADHTRFVIELPLHQKTQSAKASGMSSGAA